MSIYDGVSRESLVSEYLKHTDHLEHLQKMTATMKKAMNEWVDEGDEDDKGHRWLKVGKYLLQKQRRQGASSLDTSEVEKWAKERGVWGQVSKTIEVVDEDALMAFVYDHRDEDGLEDLIKTFYKEAPVSYAFIKPKVEDDYDY